MLELRSATEVVSPLLLLPGCFVQICCLGFFFITEHFTVNQQNLFWMHRQSHLQAFASLTLFFSPGILCGLSLPCGRLAASPREVVGLQEPDSRSPQVKICSFRGLTAPPTHGVRRPGVGWIPNLPLQQRRGPGSARFLALFSFN